MPQGHLHILRNKIRNEMCKTVAQLVPLTWSYLQTYSSPLKSIFLWTLRDEMKRSCFFIKLFFFPKLSIFLILPQPKWLFQINTVFSQNTRTVSSTVGAALENTEHNKIRDVLHGFCCCCSCGLFVCFSFEVGYVAELN